MSTDDESFEKCESCLSGKMTKKPFPHSNERAKDLLGIIHTDVWGCEALVKRDTPDKLKQRTGKGIYKDTQRKHWLLFYFPPENKIVVARYAEFFEKRLINQEISGNAVDLEEIQEEEDTTPSENTSNIPQEVEGFEPPQPPQEEEIPIRRVDYEEMFSPVADIRAIIILISIATYYDYEIWKMDVKTAFLNGYLDEDIYMVQPEEMEAVWIRKFISGLGIVPTINEPIEMFCDNSAALLIANEPRVQMGAKHYHRSILLKVHTDDNLAYPFTKALPKGKLTQHAKSMGFVLLVVSCRSVF
ncbi:retrotransposon protein, putative, ty1-copia subclass [Tanacetum coccineum]